MAIEKLPIGSIQVEHRFRKDLGDLDALAESIAEIGLLHPIVVTPDHRLVAGQRRLEACQRLGWAAVPVHIVALDDIRRGEFAENTCRQDFLPSEMVAIAKALEPAEKAAARERMIDAHASPVRFSEQDRGEAKEKVASFVGVSRPTLEKAAKVVEAAEADPQYVPLVAEMDRTGRVDGAYRKLIETQRIERIKAEEIAPPTGKYRCVVVDPPWPMEKILRETRPNQDAFDYERMSIDDIKRLAIPVNEDGCHVYLWTTQRFLPDAFSVFEAWGVQYECMLTWVKNVGFTPFSFMYSTEHVLFGRVGNLPLLKKGERLDFAAKVREHSRKPDAFYALLERVSPGPRIDMFSREDRDGWVSWGREAGKLGCAVPS
jgi:N6-adenosine-specific RNA methylase IME4/ParB-like chromosome segregation protein Spo0J